MSSKKLLSKTVTLFGKRVTACAVLKRKRRPGGRRSDERYWDREPFDNSRVGIVVGLRTFTDGIFTWEDHGPEYRSKIGFRAYLVAFDLLRRPEVVLVDDMVLSP